MSEEQLTNFKSKEEVLAAITKAHEDFGIIHDKQMRWNATNSKENPEEYEHDYDEHNRWFILEGRLRETADRLGATGMEIYRAALTGLAVKERRSFFEVLSEGMAEPDSLITGKELHQLQQEFPIQSQERSTSAIAS